MGICDKLGLIRPIADQCEYSAICRDKVDKDFNYTFRDYNYGTTVYSPMAGGLLSGKYNDGSYPKGSRMERDALSGMFMAKYWADKERTLKTLNALADIAKEVGCTQPQLALAWVLVNKDVTTCLFGARTPEQVEENMKAMEVAKKWTPELEAKIEEALGNAPEMPLEFPGFAPATARRSFTVDYDLAASQKNVLLINPPDHMKKSAQ